MNPRRRNLLIKATFIVVGVAAATLLGLKAFQENLLYFYSPSQIDEKRHPCTGYMNIDYPDTFALLIIRGGPK